MIAACYGTNDRNSQKTSLRSRYYLVALTTSTSIHASSDDLCRNGRPHSGPYTRTWRRMTAEDRIITHFSSRARTGPHYNSRHPNTTALARPLNPSEMRTCAPNGHWPDHSHECKPVMPSSLFDHVLTCNATMQIKESVCCTWGTTRGVASPRSCQMTGRCHTATSWES